MSTHPALSRRSFFAGCAAAAAGPVLLPASITAFGLAAGEARSDGSVPAAPTVAPTASTPASMPAGDGLQSEFLFDLVLERGLANNVGSPGANRVIVPVAGGAFEGPRLKGSVVGPSGDWIVSRPDGSSVLDIRVVLQTDDGQKIYMSARGIAYALPGGSLFARIVPAFETGAPGYTWLNNVVAVGVNRPMPGKVSYRVYQIL